MEKSKNWQWRVCSVLVAAVVTAIAITIVVLVSRRHKAAPGPGSMPLPPGAPHNFNSNYSHALQLALTFLDIQKCRHFFLLLHMCHFNFSSKVGHFPLISPLLLLISTYLWAVNFVLVLLTWICDLLISDGFSSYLSLLLFGSTISLSFQIHYLFRWCVTLFCFSFLFVKEFFSFLFLTQSFFCQWKPPFSSSQRRNNVFRSSVPPHLKCHMHMPDFARKPEVGGFNVITIANLGTNLTLSSYACPHCFIWIWSNNLDGSTEASFGKLIPSWLNS